MSSLEKGREKQPFFIFEGDGVDRQEETGQTATRRRDDGQASRQTETSGGVVVVVGVIKVKPSHPHQGGAATTTRRAWFQVETILPASEVSLHA
jgi:hypothetical protein